MLQLFHSDGLPTEVNCYTLYPPPSEGELRDQSPLKYVTICSYLQLPKDDNMIVSAIYFEYW